MEEDGPFQCFKKGDVKIWISKWAMVGARAKVGARATVGAWATVGEGAKVQHCISLGPIGSRDATFHYLPELGIFCTGGFYGSESEFRAKLKETHADDEHTKPYLLAVDFLKQMAEAKGIKRTKQKECVKVGD